MHLKHKAVRAIVALAGMAAAMFVTQLAATPAQAYCAGENEERVLQLMVNGNLLAREVSVPNTCNGNTTYQGTIYSFEEGWTVVALVKDGTNWSYFYGPSNWGGSIQYLHGDSNSHTALVICVTRGNDWTCGNNTHSVNSTGGPDMTKFVYNDGF